MSRKKNRAEELLAHSLLSTNTIPVPGPWSPLGEPAAPEPLAPAPTSAESQPAPSSTPSAAPGPRYMRGPEVESRTGLSRATIWRKMRGVCWPRPTA